MTKIPLENQNEDELKLREQFQKERTIQLVQLEQDLKDAEQNGVDPDVLSTLKARFDMAIILNYLDRSAISYLKMYRNYETLTHLHELNGRVSLRKVSER